MAHSVTHQFVSPKADSGDSTIVQPSNWNDTHTVTIDASLVDHGSLAGLSDDDHTSYHTDARALTWLGTRSTADLPEGANLYYTDARADARVAVHTGDTTDAHAASAITNTPAGNISATTVQAAIDELDTEKSSTSHNHDASYQPLDAGLTDIAALAVTDGNIIVGDGANWVAESGATARTSLGLGSIATQAANSVSITGGSVTGITDLAVADGGTGASTATAAFDALSPVTTRGDIIIRDASNNVRLAVGAANTFLGSDGTDPSYRTAAQVRTSLGLAFGTTDNALLRADGTGNSATQGSVATLDDNGLLTISGSSAAISLFDTNSASTLTFGRSDTHGDAAYVGVINFQGRDSGAVAQRYGSIDSYCVLDNAGAEDGLLEFLTVRSGTEAYRMLIGAGVYHGSATGGDKGANTINFGAVYDDNTLLTCYVFDAALDGGKINLKKWDDLTPNIDYEEVKPDGTKERVFQERTHEPLRKFAARLGGDEDPLDLDKYINHWKTKRHLTSLPNEANFDPVKGLPAGAWIQRLVETVEIQAVHISQLNDRIKALEGRATARG